MTILTRKTLSGFSIAAETIQRIDDDERKRRSESVTFSDHPLHDQLIDVFGECSEPNWDGVSAQAVTQQTLMIAFNLLRLMPKRFRNPTVAGESDGHVSFEWYVSPRRILNLSISPEGKLHWAALIGSEDPRGSCQFYDEIPKTLEYLLGRVCRK
jgi:hypothetical protein